MKSDQEKEIISRYMAELGRRSAKINKKKGSEFFKWVRSHRKDEKDETKETNENK